MDIVFALGAAVMWAAMVGMVRGCDALGARS